MSTSIITELDITSADILAVEKIISKIESNLKARRESILDTHKHWWFGICLIRDTETEHLGTLRESKEMRQKFIKVLNHYIEFGELVLQFMKDHAAFDPNDLGKLISCMEGDIKLLKTDLKCWKNPISTEKSNKTLDRIFSAKES
jgi:hypothetical protein